MHLIVIKREFYEKHKWLPYSLYKAFVESKSICEEEMTAQSALEYMLPWLIPELEETKRIMGEDFWPYGLEPNRKALDTFITYNIEQGLIENTFKVEDLFASETLNVTKI
jgi:4,5-dihydroxyphthalate decarboxylase